MPLTRSNGGTAQSTDRRKTVDTQPRPLLLRLANLAVHGHEFVAEVQIEGRALAVSWNGSWLIATVEPAGFGEIGDELHEAFGRLRGNLCATLFHIAEETSGYADFERRARVRLGQVDLGRHRHWIEAIDAVGGRNGRDRPHVWDGWGEHDVKVEIERIDRPGRHHTPEDNRVDALIVLDRRAPPHA